ncbi:hypothetical protein ASG47_18700 [Devosia sp. Leaf420]|uniref:hypothetical protein n=1 Tax=Devosia sp. Leaf420 TaxID=1736374 RepID=UPI000713732F|nr:hypothetical protein [Devosia sp. Leaf420]KQT51205.1 hypothetical protein ASG47_18700 [Devosia sp. Leaf420]
MSPNQEPAADLRIRSNLTEENYIKGIEGDHIQRLKRKKDGGYHSRKGHDYEDFYAIYLLSFYFGDALAAEDATAFKVEAGSDSLVDDLLLQTPNGDIYVQAKTEKDLKWNIRTGAC